MGAGLGVTCPICSAVNSPGFDGKGESFARYEKEVEIWNHITSLDVTKRGPACVTILPRWM